MTNQETALATVGTGAVAAPESAITRAQIEVFKRAIASDLTDAETQFVLEWCRHAQVSPFLRHIHVWKQGGKLQFQISIDGMRAIGMRSGKFRGRLGPFWCGPDGEWRDVWLTETPPVAAKVGILWAGLDQPVWGVCRIGAYKSRPGAGPLWNVMADVMGAKVAEAVAWRVVSPVDMGGLYVGGELADEPAAVSQYATVEQIGRIKHACELLNVVAPADEELADLTYDEAEEIVTQYRRQWKERQRATITPESEAA
jgi:hypothetical protein